MKTSTRRRIWWGLASTALVLAATAGGAVAHADTATTAPLALPAPTGRHPVGTVALHLIDHSRTDPWTGSGPRELMVSAFYPAARTAGFPRAPYMLPEAAAHFGTVDVNDYLGLNLPTDIDWAATRTHAFLRAPVHRRGGRLPVLLYSPGLGEPRTFATTLVTELASRGYLVVTIDNTYDSPEVQFPDGRLALLTDPRPTVEWVTKLIDTRVADTSFVIDQLGAIAAGREPDADGAKLPLGLRGAPDLGRIGMFGHSAGGFAAAQAMYDDARIRAGINMDGTMTYNPMDPAADLSPVAANGLNRPFLLMASDPSNGGQDLSDPSWASFWARTRSFRAGLTVLGTSHASFTDAEALIPQLASAGVPASTIVEDIGPLDPARAVTIQQTYISAFFDRFLLGRPTHLLDGPSPAYPEAQVVR